MIQTAPDTPDKPLSLVERLSRAAMGLNGQDLTKFIPRGVNAGDCIEAAARIRDLERALEEARGERNRVLASLGILLGCDGMEFDPEQAGDRPGDGSPLYEAHVVFKALTNPQDKQEAKT